MKRLCVLLTILAMLFSLTLASAEAPELPQGANIVVLKAAFSEEEALILAVESGLLSLESLGTVTVAASLSDALELIATGAADALLLTQDAAQYITQDDPSLAMISTTAEVDFRILANLDKTEQMVLINKALATMKDDGTLDNLARSLIQAVLEGEAPMAIIGLPEYDEPLRVGISGDLPPLDLLTENGKATGFSTAIVTELAMRTGITVEFVPVQSDARFDALAAGEIDAFFWSLDFSKLITDASEDLVSLLDLSEDYLLSNIYYTDALAWLVKAE